MIKCKVNLPKFSLMLVGILACIFFIFSFDDYYFPAEEHHHYIYVNISKSIFKTDEKFLSVAIDTSFMKNSFVKLNSSDWELIVNLTHFLSPAYLRLGGTAADQVLFILDDTENEVDEQYESAENMSYHEKENISPRDYLNISGQDWIKFTDFATKSGLNLILDLNVLLRDGNRWDSRNAEELLSFSDLHGLEMDFQLGNEPNSFQHVFNISISGMQLGRDFNTLRGILYGWKRFSKSQLIGPDVTRPKHLDESSLHYLEDFLSTANNLSAISWHQYYLNGRTATVEEFLDPKTLDILPQQITAIKKVVHQFSSDTPIWLSETSSAYGGGAPGLSDRFLASFLWLDKLGLAAKMGTKVVIRQSLLQGYYALIGHDLSPLPDYWISLFYKLLIGRNVLHVRFSKSQQENHLRLYCHCLRKSEKISGNVVLFGMNMSNRSEYVIPGGLATHHPVTPLIFTAPDNNLTSKSILLNGRPLKFNAQTNDFASYFVSSLENLPLNLAPYSIAFFIFHGERDGVCREE